MDELIRLVSKKTGVSAEIAKTAVETVIGFLKNKLPAPIAGQLDSVLGGTGAANGAASVAKGLGGFLGKK